MDSTARNTPNRSNLLYIVVAVVLAVAVIGGVLWVKNRSDRVATNETTLVQEDQAPEEDENEYQPPSDDEVAVNDAEEYDGYVSGTATNDPSDPALPTTVPSAGTTGVLLPGAALAACVFAAVLYVQSRRRLMAVVQKTSTTSF